MPLPPQWLIEWIQYVVLLAGAIAAIQALWEGGRVLKYKANKLKG